MLEEYIWINWSFYANNFNISDPANEVLSERCQGTFGMALKKWVGPVKSVGYYRQRIFWTS